MFGAASGVSFNSFLQQVATGDNVKDYQHAARLFIDSLYRLSPKYTFLFHVFVDINPNASAVTGRIDVNSQIEIGMLAKNAQLPKFSIKNKIYNAYNRKNIVQDAVQYEPISITFHDDSADVVRGFWGDYYSYYYRDGDYPDASYKVAHKYNPRSIQNWGFTPRSAVPYLSAIRIYSLHQKYFSSYELINPLITSFRHGEHQQGDNTTMQHEMTVAYEGVKYFAGTVVGGQVDGFDIIHYDNSPSPITPAGGLIGKILSSSGVTTNPISFINDLSILGSTIGAVTGNPVTTGAGTGYPVLPTVISDVLKGQNMQSTIFAPTAASVSDGLATAVASITPSYTSQPDSVVNMNGSNGV